MLHFVRNPQPTVTRMGDKFFDIHKMSELLHLVKRSVDTSGSKIELRDKVRWIKVTRFGWYQYRHSLTKEEPWKEVFLLRSDVEIPLIAPSVELQPRQTLMIKKAKLDR